MKIPILNVFALGKFTPWANNILKSLEKQEVIKIDPDIRTVDSFCELANLNGKPSVVVIEQPATSRKEIEKICHLGRSVYLLGLAKNFTSDDLLYAIKSRIYFVFDSTQTDEMKLIEACKNLSNQVDSEHQFQQILRAMKSILLQTEAEIPDIPMVKELRTAISKMEHLEAQNEFNHMNLKGTEQHSDLIFHRAQTLSETLALVSEVGRTGTLWVKSKSKEKEGTIDFIQGRILGASVSGCDGVKAIYRMFIWGDPTFLFYRKDPREMSTIKPVGVDVAHIIRVGELLTQRFDKIKSKLPPSSLKLRVSSDSISDNFALSQNEFSTLSSVVEHETVENIVDFNPLSDVEIYESLITLRKNKIIQPAT